MERKIVIGLAALGLVAVGGVVAWADEAPTPEPAVTAHTSTDPAPAAAQRQQASDAPQPDSSAGHSAVADNGEKMHEEMMSSRAHEMGMEHGARQMHDEMRDRQMPQQMSGMPASGAQAGAPMKMGDPCSGSGCKAGDPGPAPMPMGHM